MKPFRILLGISLLGSAWGCTAQAPKTPEVQAPKVQASETPAPVKSPEPREIQDLDQFMKIPGMELKNPTGKKSLPVLTYPTFGVEFGAEDEPAQKTYDLTQAPGETALRRIDKEKFFPQGKIRFTGKPGPFEISLGDYPADGFRKEGFPGSPGPSDDLWSLNLGLVHLPPFTDTPWQVQITLGSEVLHQGSLVLKSFMGRDLGLYATPEPHLFSMKNPKPVQGPGEYLFVQAPEGGVFHLVLYQQGTTQGYLGGSTWQAIGLGTVPQGWEGPRKVQWNLEPQKPHILVLVTDLDKLEKDWTLVSGLIL